MAAKIGRLFRRYPADERVGLLRAALSGPATASPASARHGPLVALQSVEDPLYFAIFSAIFWALQQRREVQGALVVVRAVSGAVGTGWRARLLRTAPVAWILSTQWVRVYRGLVDRVGYRSHCMAHPLGDGVDWLRSASLWLRMRRGQAEFKLDIRGVAVGDLVVDTYLRFRPSPRFDAADPFVIRLIWQAHRDVRRAQAFFGRSRPALYLTSYSTYLEHGIPVRVALQAGVPVYSFGNLVQFGKRLSLEDWFHTPNCDNYRKIFSSLDNQAQKRAQAEELLTFRLGGGVDPATSYMQTSAYAGRGEPVPEGLHGAVVVFLHDFYDSPHVYGDMVFEDFWTWICFTIEVLQREKVVFFLKPHPNQIALGGAVLTELQSAYPGVQFLSPRLANTQLANAGVACGVTVYGTVAHELAYLGIPTVSCARHPHHSFDFCRTARTRDEYAAFLATPFDLPADRDSMRAQALAFFYMHNLHGEPEKIALGRDFVSFWKACQNRDTEASTLLAAFNTLRHSAAFGRFIETLL